MGESKHESERMANPTTRRPLLIIIRPTPASQVPTPCRRIHSNQQSLPWRACMMMIVDLEGVKKRVKRIFVCLLIRSIVFCVARTLLSGIIEDLHL